MSCLKNEKAVYFVLILLAGLIIRHQAYADYLPNTEKGNVIVRQFDQYNIPTGYIYIGHVGIMGDWQGNTSSNAQDYYVYDLGTQSGASPNFDGINLFKILNCTINRRTFQDFQNVNALLFISGQSYAGGYTGIMPSTVDQRNRIIELAEQWRSVPLTTILFPFTKLPAQGRFRCDGFVEYIYEQANIYAGMGNVIDSLEITVLTPAQYVSPLNAESGAPPQLNNISRQFSGSNIIVNGTAFDGLFGSGIRQIRIGYRQSNQFSELARDNSSSIGTKNFSFTLLQTQIPSGITEGEIQTYDGAGDLPPNVLPGVRKLSTVIPGPFVVAV